jgi:uncharacterized protein (DUF2141 family)
MIHPRTQSSILFLILSLIVTGFEAFPQAKEKHTILPTVDIRPFLTDKKPTTDAPTYSITITVINIRNKEGVLRFKFHDDNTPFQHETGFLRIVVPKTAFEGDSFTVTYTGFSSKNMAIALGDDENNNVELDMGWFYPKEGHAFSDYYHTAFRRPVYKDFDFFLDSDRKVLMKMRYY